MSLNAKLVVVGGEVKTAEIKLRLPSTIGRGRGATIMLPHPLVSRQHCELFETDGRLMVRDLGSLNGTFVNNERIAGDAALPPGELLTVGAVTFRAMYESEESNAPPEGPGPQMKSAQTVSSDPHGTIRTGPNKTPAPPGKPQLLEDDDADFNFDQPLMPVDEEAAPANAQTDPIGESPRSPATLKEAAKPPTTPAPGKNVKTIPAKPVAVPAKVAAKPAPSAPAKPAAPSKDEQTADLKKWQDDQDDAVENPGGDDEEDFGDFLKSLDKK